MTDWRTMDRATLTAAYDNGAAVADSAARLARWRSLGAALRAEHPATLDLRYGPLPRNTLDLFACGRPRAPLLAFIHGGWWMRNAKEGFAGMAAGPLALGMDVAMLGYTLAPDASLTEIAAEIRAALAFLRHREGGRAGPLVVSGWSAGGHLAALAADRGHVDASRVDACLAISGAFDLAPLRGTALNDTLAITPEEVEALSPARVVGHGSWPHRPCPTVVAYGADELPEMRRQSEDYAAARAAAGAPTRLLPLVGADHFSILDAMMAPDGALARAAADLAEAARKLSEG